VDDAEKYLLPENVAQLRGLVLRARRIVEGYVAGLHRSPYEGFSIEFAEHREYTPGDDLRYVDWKAFGRSDKIYLKQYEEETNLICYLLLDVSESMSYQGPSAPMSKIDYARSVAAALCYLVLHQQDSVGLVTFDDQVRSVLRPTSQASQLAHLTQRMQQESPSRKTSTGPIFHELAERLKKRGIVIVLSDLFDDVPTMMAGLKHFRHRRHDVIVLQVLDPAEIEFPFQQTTLFKGLEEYPEVVADPATLRKAYLGEFDRFQRAVKRACRDYRFDLAQLPTDRSLGTALSTYLAGRTARIK
jgi:uncharacterized protein (DUF58 family)